MPKPRKGETRQRFVNRCVPEVIREEDTQGQKHALGKCYGMYDYAQEKARRSKRRGKN
jgi:hypothetical protein